MFSVITLKTRSQKLLKIICNYDEKPLTFTVLCDKLSHTAKVVKEDVKRFAKSYEIEPNEYYKKLQLYLTEQSDDISADIIGDKFNLYRKKNLYFSCSLERANYELVLENLLDTSVKNNQVLQKKLDQTIKEKGDVLKDKDLYKRKLEEHTKEYAKRENKVYACFVKLLNEKKRRIQFLTDVLEARGENAERQSLRREEVSDSEISNESAVEYNTDEEVEEELPVEDAVQSTSNVDDFDFFGDVEETSSTQRITARKAPPENKSDDGLLNANREAGLARGDEDGKGGESQIFDSMELGDDNSLKEDVHAAQNDSPAASFCVEDLLNRM